MLRTSGYLAIALSITALGSAATSAAANPLQVFGGANSHLAAQFHPATASNSVQSSPQAGHVLIGVRRIPPSKWPGRRP